MTAVDRTPLNRVLICLCDRCFFVSFSYLVGRKFGFCLGQKKKKGQQKWGRGYEYEYVIVVFSCHFPIWSAENSDFALDKKKKKANRNGGGDMNKNVKKFDVVVVCFEYCLQ